MVAIHYFLQKGLEYAVPKELKGALILTECVIFVIFLIIYVKLGWDMIAVFIPRLQGKKEAIGIKGLENEKSNETGTEQQPEDESA
jgi:hypothetical protein